MENELRNIWIEVEGHLTPWPENELHGILRMKIRFIINKFRWIWGIGTIICAGVLIFLATASFSLRDDLLYLINNSVLAVLLIVAAIYNLRIYFQLNSVPVESRSVHSLLREKSRKIEKAMQQKKQLYLLPVFSILLLLAIHIFFSGDSYKGTFSNEEDMWGIALGFVSGLLVAVYFERKINRNLEKDLKALRTYLQELERNS